MLAVDTADVEPGERKAVWWFAIIARRGPCTFAIIAPVVIVIIITVGRA